MASMARPLLKAFLLLVAFVGCMPSLAWSPVQVVPLTSPVVDTTNTLSAAELAQLEQQALALQQRKGSQLQILIVASTQPEDIAAYTQRVFDAWKLGRKGADDGVLLVVAKDDHRVRIQTGYGLEGAIPDAAAGRIIQEYLVPKFRANDYAGGITDASAQLVRLIDGEALPPPMAVAPERGGDGDWFDGIFWAFFASIFARGLFGALPRLLRMALMGTLAAVILSFFTVPWWVIVIVSVIAAAIGASTPSGRYARDRGWGNIGSGGGWSGGSSSDSSGGGGWSGGGGSSGGGGASGSW